MTPRVGIVILHHGDAAQTVACLESVAALEYPRVHVVVVDNGGHAAALRAAVADHGSAEIVPLSENLGYCIGNNLGMRRALERGASLVWLLNNDTRVPPHAVDRLVDAAGRRPGAGLFSPLIAYLAEPERIQFCGVRLDRRERRIVAAGTPEEAAAWERERPAEVCLYGTALLVRAEVVERIGGLDPRFFAYWEDLDYSARAAAAGFASAVVPDVRVLHDTPLHRGGERIESPSYYYYMTRNEYLFWTRDMARPARAAYARSYLTRVLRDARGYASEAGEACGRAAVRGALHALAGRTGPAAGGPGRLDRWLLRHAEAVADLLSAAPAPVAAGAWRRLREGAGRRTA